jgi:PPOX class probable F420-dependent enzyme
MAGMSPAERDAFLRETRIAKLATLNEDGSPNVVPVWFEWTGEEALVFTGRTSPKVRRIERDNRVALSVEEPVGVAEAWVTVEGRCEVDPDTDATWELVKRLAARYYAPERANTALKEWEAGRANWVTLRIRPTRIRDGG